MPHTKAQNCKPVTRLKLTLKYWWQIFWREQWMCKFLGHTSPQTSRDQTNSLSTLISISIVHSYVSLTVSMKPAKSKHDYNFQFCTHRLIVVKVGWVLDPLLCAFHKYIISTLFCHTVTYWAITQFSVDSRNWRITDTVWLSVFLSGQTLLCQCYKIVIWTNMHQDDDHIYTKRSSGKGIKIGNAVG